MTYKETVSNILDKATKDLEATLGSPLTHQQYISAASSYNIKKLLTLMEEMAEALACGTDEQEWKILQKWNGPVEYE